MFITRENQSCSKMRVVKKSLIKEQITSKEGTVSHPMAEKKADAYRIELKKSSSETTEVYHNSLIY